MRDLKMGAVGVIVTSMTDLSIQRELTSIQKRSGKLIKVGQKIRTGIFIIVALLFSVNILNASIVEISVATDKPIYQLGEDVKIFVTAYNPNPQPVTLTTGYYFASYIMDGVYDWVEQRQSAPQIILYKTIEPYDYATYLLTHDSLEMQRYPLELGMHSVVGEILAAELIGNNESAPAQFEVVPEPSTFLLLALGVFVIRAKGRNKSH